MKDLLAETFKKCKEQGRPAYIPYITAGYPTKNDTVELLLGLQDGGSDIIELGVPFSDPIADGPTIQKSSFDALKHGITLADCIEFVRTARSRGLTVPVILMSYYNPIVAYGEKQLVDICSEKEVNISGFIVVDSDLEDFEVFSSTCSKKSLALIPLVAPTTTDARLEEISKSASGYTYCVSVTGVTGARTSLPEGVEEYTARVGKFIPLPRALGFGLATHAHYEEVKGKNIAEGVVMGSKVIKVIKESFEKGDDLSKRRETLTKFVKEVITGSTD